MIITLCGSSRFEAHYHAWNEVLGLAGHAAFGLSSYPSQHSGDKDWYETSDKITLDLVHKAKIDASQAILVLNVFGYLGASTLSEIAHAKKRGLQIFFLASYGERIKVSAGCSTEYAAALFRFDVPIDYESPIDTTPFRSAWHPELLGYGGPKRSRLVARLHDLLDPVVRAGDWKGSGGLCEKSLTRGKSSECSPRPLWVKDEWMQMNCGECDVSFPCYGGAGADECIRTPRRSR